MTEAEVTQALAFAHQLAREAGRVMLENFTIGAITELKADQSPVTYADKQINQRVIEAVQQAYPEHAVVGEEASLERPGARHVWVCDPIDGTLPYSMGIPTNVFSLALVYDGQPVIGVVYDPYLDRLYSAARGGEATVNNLPIHVQAAPSTLKDAWIGTSSPYQGAVDRADLEVALQDAGARQLSFASCVYEAMLVATGQFAGVVFGGTTAHDIAAVKVIVEAAGGRVTDLTGCEQPYDCPINGAVVSSGPVHAELLKLVKRAQPHL